MSDTKHKIVTRVDDRTYQQVQEAADSDDRSVASWIRQLIANALDEHQNGNRK